jgi:NAD dependent epimerase/dehydratase family enzyme
MGIINLILNNVSIEGAINLSAPQVTTNKEFSKLLAKKYQRLCIFNVPSLGAKLVFGKMGEELLLSSQKIFPHKALENGYDFKYVNISDAIQNI